MTSHIRIHFSLSNAESISAISVTKEDARLAAAEILANIRDHLDVVSQAAFLHTLAAECEKFAGDGVDGFLSNAGIVPLADGAIGEPTP